VRLGLHGVEEVEDALGVGDDCGDLLCCIAQDELITAYCVYPVGQPDGLLAFAGWPVGDCFVHSFLMLTVVVVLFVYV
jgi:hypothetical protein